MLEQLQQPLDFLVAALATYRVARMIVAEDGPFDVFVHFRTAVYLRFNDDHWITKGVNCPLCVSFWVALVVPFTPVFVLYWLAIAGAATVLFVREQ